MPSSAPGFWGSGERGDLGVSVDAGDFYGHAVFLAHTPVRKLSQAHPNAFPDGRT